jgi:hypothetical protein
MVKANMAAFMRENVEGEHTRGGLCVYVLVSGNGEAECAGYRSVEIVVVLNARLSFDVFSYTIIKIIFIEKGDNGGNDPH